MIEIIKKPLRFLYYQFRQRWIDNKLTKLVSITSLKDTEYFFNDFKSKIIKFILSNQVDQKNYLYKFSINSTKPTLYASVYAAMTLDIVGKLKNLSEKEKDQWRKYFDKFQNEFDGLFYDPVVQNNIYNDGDWWGCRHLALHIISAYTRLGYRPKYPFFFLKKYYNTVVIEKWLEEFDWQKAIIGESDLDNKIMNIGCLLQYQRDYWKDTDAGNAVEFLKIYLRSKINKKTGMWGGFDIDNPHQRSRMIQFAYHLFQLYFYDDDYQFDYDKIINLTLKTQNKLNGFGVNLNSSACEDIDSIDTLIRLQKKNSPETQNKIRLSIEKSFYWALTNQVEDGGFVFKLEEPFVYGCIETSSKINKGDMMSTWFRTLSIVKMANYLGVKNNFQTTNCPGYEFK
jgi:hypothetical protein